MEVDKKKLIFAIEDFLDSVKTEEGADTESIEAAIQCLKVAFSLDIEKEEDRREYAIQYPLFQIFSTYLAFTKDAIVKKESFILSTGDKVIERVEVDEESEKLAEEKKIEGNQLVSSKKFHEAIDAYSQAISLNPNSSVYYANRFLIFLFLFYYFCFYLILFIYFYIILIIYFYFILLFRLFNYFIFLLFCFICFILFYFILINYFILFYLFYLFIDLFICYNFLYFSFF